MINLRDNKQFKIDYKGGAIDDRLSAIEDQLRVVCSSITGGFRFGDPDPDPTILHSVLKYNIESDDPTRHLVGFISIPYNDLMWIVTPTAFPIRSSSNLGLIEFNGLELKYQLESEIDYAGEQLADGEITSSEYNKKKRETDQVCHLFERYGLEIGEVDGVFAVTKGSDNLVKITDRSFVIIDHEYEAKEVFSPRRIKNCMLKYSKIS